MGSAVAVDLSLVVGLGWFCDLWNPVDFGFYTLFLFVCRFVVLILLVFLFWVLLVVWLLGLLLFWLFGLFVVGFPIWCFDLLVYLLLTVYDWVFGSG